MSADSSLRYPYRADAPNYNGAGPSAYKASTPQQTSPEHYHWGGSTAGAGGVRRAYGRTPPSDSFWTAPGSSRSPVPRTSLSPRPSPGFGDPSNGSYYGSPPSHAHASLMPSPPRPRSPLPPSAIVTATADLESLIVVPLNGLATVEAVKDVVMTRLHIADDDQPRQSFHLTQIGAGEGRAVSDEDLWVAIKASARGDGPQNTVYVKEIGSPQASLWGGGADTDAFVSAASQRRMRGDEPRDREMSRSSGSGGRAPSPHSAAGFHRQKSPSVSSVSRASDPVAPVVPPSLSMSVDDLSRRPLGSGASSAPPRQLSTPTYSTQRMTTSPQSSSTVLSPAHDSQFDVHGGAGRAPGSLTPKTSPEEYFQPLPTGNRLGVSPAGSAALSPPTYGPQGYYPGSPGFAGTPRRLPSAPVGSSPTDSRTQSVPLLSVTSADWSRPVAASAPHHSPNQAATQTFAPHPPRAHPPTDPRRAMRQYASDPYRNLPPPSNQSPYHNLSLQGQSNVVHLPQPSRYAYQSSAAPPPRAATLAAPSPSGGLALSRSADNLRGTFDAGTIDSPGPSRSPVSRISPQSSGRSGTDPFGGHSPNPASAFYSAPVQAQHQSGTYSARSGSQVLSPQSASTTRSDLAGALERPSTATGFMHDTERSRFRQESASSSVSGRSRSGTLGELEHRFSSQMSLFPAERSREERSEASAPVSAEEKGADEGSAAPSRIPSQPSAGSTTAPTSPPSSTRSSLTGPITPASDLPLDRFSPAAAAAAPPPTTEKPILVDEFGDPLDEETGTWFPVNQPTPPPQLTTPQPAPPQPTVTPTPVRKPSHSSSHSPHATTAVPAPKSYGPGSPTRPQPSPSTPALQLNERRDQVPDAQDWTQTILSRFGASSATDGGTLLPGGPTGTLRPGAGPPPASTSPAPAAPRVVDEFGDELEDASTFFPGHGPVKPAPAASTSLSRNDSARGRTLMSRPSLKLKIGANASGAQGAPPQSTVHSGKDNDRSAGRKSAAGERESARAGAGGGRRTGPPRQDRSAGEPESPFAYRNSMAARASDDNDWAFRPPVETVLEHLDVFFPQHDLDKPVFDLAAPSPSSANTTHSSPAKEPTSTVSSRRSNLAYHKSIRVVAQDRKRMLQKAGRNVATAASGLASNLLRRRSTKLFGAKIEEVTSDKMGEINSLHEATNEDPENFSYKWIKGDLIGRGTYGHVYIALSVTTGETIAVKQVEMPRTFSDKEDQRIKGMISSLKAEIELLKDLDHPNIVLYLGMEQTPEFLSIFLEYVPGGSIGRIIRTHGKFEEDVIRFFTLQILDGLQYLHGLGILHRDMKADNILIDQDGMCKISDFGTSKKSGDIYQNDENMSMQGSIFWMAPEVIHNNKQGYSAKADIWSLGCICIEMLAGSRPWEGEGFMGAMFKLGAERMRPPLPPDIELSENADHFVGECLQIDPDLRPKASEAKSHPFLTSLDPRWSFDQTALYRIMTSEEQRRRLPINSNSAAATHAER
ncbi:mitogen-activated protein kinase kinase kinase [Rhodotorula sphaerocarpa]